jgi:hypothetical protein
LVGCGDKQVTGMPNGIYHADDVHTQVCDGSVPKSGDLSAPLQGWLGMYAGTDGPNITVSPCLGFHPWCEHFLMVGLADEPFKQVHRVADGQRCTLSRFTLWYVPTPVEEAASLTLRLRRYTQTVDGGCPQSIDVLHAKCLDSWIRARFVSPGGLAPSRVKGDGL